MQLPSGDRLIRVWEWGGDREMLDRVLGLLAEAMPETTRDALAERTIAERDGLLLELRVLLFGERLEVKSACPACTADVEFAVDASRLRAPVPDAGPHMVEADGWQARFRLPTSVDLAAVAGESEAQSRRGLIARCVHDVMDPAGAPQSEAPPTLVAAIADQMRTLSPQTDIRFRLSCPDCDHAWSTALAIAPFLWAEFESECRRLMAETHELALRYGWAEADVLRMSGARRKFYLDLQR